MLAAKFDAKATKVEAWVAGKDEALIMTDDIDSSNLAEIMVSSLSLVFQDTQLGQHITTLFQPLIQAFVMPNTYISVDILETVLQH